MALRDHIKRPELLPSPLTAETYTHLTRWRAAYILGTTYGRATAERLLFLRWLREQGRLGS